MEAAYYVAGIDVHKKMLAVVVANARDRELQFECRRFGTTVCELQKLATWLREYGVQEVVMESTAQYWKPVWFVLEGQFQLWLAQARSNRGPRGRKTDFRDAKRSVSRLLSDDLILSYVPEAKQRGWRTLTRTKYQLRRDRVRLQSQLESLLEECPIKLSSVVSDLLGASGQRILYAIAAGETDLAQLRALGDKRLHATDEELRDALNGQPQPLHRRLLKLYLERLNLIEGQIAELEKMIAEAMKAHEDAVVRLSELPGLGVDSAQQIIAEIGPPCRELSLGGATGVVGGGLSWAAGECRSVQQQPVSQGEPRNAPPAEPTRPRSRAQARLLSANLVQTLISTSGLCESSLGHCSSLMSIDLEGIARRCPVRRARASRERSNAETPKAAARNPAQEAGIFSSTNSDHGFRDGPIGFFEGVAGESG
jgi:transposase